MARIMIPVAEAMLDVPIKVLDHGFVTPVDYMGGDKRIVDAARVSIAGQQVKATQDDRQLIRYLLRHKHTTPFEKVRFEFCCKMPIFVARQWVRHRMSSINEMSARYGVLPEEFYIPELDRMQFQSTDNKQGSGTQMSESTGQAVREALLDHSRNSFDLYRQLLGKASGDSWLPDDASLELQENGGFARELARSVLPVNVYTMWYWTVDLWNLMHFLRLRLDGHAQYEIRVYAEAMYKFAQAVCPLATEAFNDYILHAKTFSRAEATLLCETALDTESGRVMISDDEELQRRLGSKREALEFRNKIKAT